MLQYFSDVILQEQIGWAHFLLSWGAIGVSLHWIYIRISAETGTLQSPIKGCDTSGRFLNIERSLLHDMPPDRLN
jgi:hypothetical protein